jgi:hypothetical protein
VLGIDIGHARPARSAYSERGVSLEAWIFMVGLRVFDIGALIIWLVWFFRLRDDDDGDDDDLRGGDGVPEPPPPGPQLDVPLPDAEPWPRRRRDHGGDVPPATAPARSPAAPHRVPERLPAGR